jgi:hypothetical protein
MLTDHDPQHSDPLYYVQEMKQEMKETYCKEEDNSHLLINSASQISLLMSP